MNRRFCLPAWLLVLAFAAFTDRHTAHSWHSLFNGKDLTGWGIYVKGSGLNNDPHHVFTVVQDGKDKVIRISGEDYGAIFTEKEYDNYHLQLMFKWGDLTWGKKKGKKKDSGLLYHSVGPYGADNGAWMRSEEFQVEQGNCGEYWGCAGATADIPAIRKSDNEYVYNPAGTLYTFRVDNHIGRYCMKAADAENPEGEWNTLDLYCHGDTSVHMVNGRVMMVLYHLGQVDQGQVSPLTGGRIQIQSEGAEIFYKQVRIEPISAIPAEIPAK